MRPLPANRRRFVDEYLVDRNATQAAIRAGYKAKNADAVSCRLLKDECVAEAIEAGLQKLAEKTGVTAEKVLLELGRLAFVDPALAFNKVTGEMLPIHSMPEDVRRALSFDFKNGKVRHNKVDALELLGKHFRLFVDRVEEDSKRFEGMSDEQVLVELLKAAPPSVRAEAWKKVAAAEKGAAH